MSWNFDRAVRSDRIRSNCRL